jgi:small ligand-binding sensory domain FIST
MTFRFASAVSQHPSLYQAIADVVTSCREGLGGRVPDLCQLLITKAHARNVAHAPKVCWGQSKHPVSIQINKSSLTTAIVTFVEVQLLLRLW